MARCREFTSSKDNRSAQNGRVVTKWLKMLGEATKKIAALETLAAPRPNKIAALEILAAPRLKKIAALQILAAPRLKKIAALQILAARG